MEDPVGGREQDIRVIICKEDDVYIAQCLEYDIAAHGSTPDEAKAAFAEAMMRHAVYANERGCRLFDGLSPAPREYWDKWESKRTSEQMKLPETVSTSRHESISTPPYLEAVDA
jgi:hypothetical protein